MKFEVIGWTDYDSTYPRHRGDPGAVRRAILKELREKGYRFGGNTHQEAETGAPILNDGTIVRCSWRGWGSIMSEALGVDNADGMAYMEWYMDTVDELLEGEPREIILPPDHIDVQRIRPREELAETFTMHLMPDAFEAVKNGEKTVEIRLNDGKRENLCKDDFIVFEGENGETVKVLVTDIAYFETLEELFHMEEIDSDFFDAEDEEEAKRNAVLVQRALFKGCDTPEQLYALLNEFYSRERQKEYYAIAIQIRRTDT